MMQPSVTRLLATLWLDYLQRNPDARRIQQLFAEHNPPLVTDHLALRTFDIPRVAIEQLARPFIAGGYRSVASYNFPLKRLHAQHFAHPDPQLPKLFISQLRVEHLPEPHQEVIHQLVSQIPASILQSDTLCCSGRHWPINFDTYRQLESVSRYAAWIYAGGYRPDHYSLLVNALKSHHSLEEVNDFLLAQGFKLHSEGGLIKGSADELLEQSSTLANTVEAPFTDQTATIPGGYVEFSQRYPQAGGTLFQGFIAESCDTMFTSTDRIHSYPG